MNLIRFLNALHNFTCAFIEGNEPYMNSKARSHSQLIKTKTKKHHRLNQHKYVYIYTQLHPLFVLIVEKILTLDCEFYDFIQLQ